MAFVRDICMSECEWPLYERSVSRSECGWPLYERSVGVNVSGLCMRDL